jgi:hypothetical protein
MADGHPAGEALDDAGVIEVVTDEAVPPLRIELLAVERDDAASFLSAMLEGVEAESCEGSRIRVIEHAEDAALFSQAIIAITRIAVVARGEVGTIRILD